MKRAMVNYDVGFRVLTGDKHSQAAAMTIMPGGKEGGPDNRHAGADQWLYVESGAGVAVIDEHAYPLEPGSLVLIQRGEAHEIRNTGTADLKTLNIYVPPAFDEQGRESAAGEP